MKKFFKDFVSSWPFDWKVSNGDGGKIRFESYMDDNLIITIFESKYGVKAYLSKKQVDELRELLKNK